MSETTPLTGAVDLPPAPQRDTRTALQSAAELLWPAPATVRIARRRDVVPPGHGLLREYLLIPDAKRPRLTPPARAPRAAAAIVRRRFGTGGPFGRTAVSAAATLLRSGLADRLARDRLRITGPTAVRGEDIESALGDILDTSVVIGLHVGTARVNRKPVLHAVDEDGTTLAFVKVGHTDEARALVRREAEMLRRLASHTFASIDVPDVITLAHWRGLDLLVLSPLLGRPVRASVRDVPFTAMRELAAIEGLRAAEIGTSEFVSRLLRLAQELPAGDTTERYVAALGALARSGTSVDFGWWHGDWQPFNMARVGRDRVGVWDWERCTSDVPLGFDALHYVLQVVLHQHGMGPEAQQKFLAQASGVAARAGLSREQGPVVLAAYAADVTERYLSLMTGPDGQLLARRAHWSLALLETAVARL
jgi:hypothetical protein